MTAAKSPAINQPRFLSRHLPILTIGSLVVGLTVGALIRQMPASSGPAAIVDVFDVIGTMWVNAIRMTVIPLIVPLLIASIAGAKSGRDAGRLGLSTFGAFMLLIIILAVISAFAAPLLFSGLHIDSATTAALRASVADTVLPTGDASIGGWFKALIPTNPIKAAADGTMLSIIVFAVAFGFAALAAPDDVRQRVVTFSHTLSSIMLIIVQAVLLVAPIGIFALTLVVGARVGGTVFTAMGYFIGVACTVYAIFVTAMFALVLARGRLSAGTIVKGVAPAMLVAAGTASSLSALPAMIEGARDTWHLPEKIYGFVLPFAVSTFKPTSAFWPISMFFVATLYGIPFGLAQLLIAVVYTIIFNATVPAIPGGGIIALSPVYVALGLPLEGLAILLAINPITDRFSTIGNVAADMALTATLATRKQTGGALRRPPPHSPARTL